MTVATDMLEKYTAAEVALLEGKIAKIGDRLLQMEDLAEIRKGRQEWEARVASERARQSGAARLGGIGLSVARMD